MLLSQCLLLSTFIHGPWPGLQSTLGAPESVILESLATINLPAQILFTRKNHFKLLKQVVLIQRHIFQNFSISWLTKFEFWELLGFLKMHKLQVFFLLASWSTYQQVSTGDVCFISESQQRTCKKYTSLFYGITKVQYFSSVRIIMNLISQSPEKYMVHFQATKPFVSIHFPYSLYRTWFPCTFIFYTLVFLTMGRFETRYKLLLFHLIVLENQCKNFNLKNIRQFALFSTTIYFIYNHLREAIMYTADHLSPATKVFVSRVTINSKRVDVGSPLCSEYCDVKLYHMSYSFIRKALNTVHFHKFLYQNGNRRSVHATGIGANYFFRHFFGSRRHICLEVVGTAKWNNLSSLCEAPLVAVTYLFGENTQHLFQHFKSQ